MDQIEKNNKGNYAEELLHMDILHIAKTLLQKIWLIVLAGIVAAVAGFSYASFVIEPTYASSIMLYVNNSSFSVGSTNFSISSSQISAAQSLVKTYIVLLQNRTTLEEVIDLAGVDYSPNYLSGMISAAPVNDTEIFSITVTSGDPYEAANIANCIAEVLPRRVSEVIEGSSMAVVDSAVVNEHKVAPSITRYTVLGFAAGILISAIAVLVFAMLDDTIHDEEYIITTYNYPILAKVPNLLGGGTKEYAYYSKRRKRSDVKAGEHDGE